MNNRMGNGNSDRRAIEEVTRKATTIVFGCHIALLLTLRFSVFLDRAKIMQCKLILIFSKTTTDGICNCENVAGRKTREKKQPVF